MFNEINAPLIRGLSTPYGPLCETDATQVDEIVKGLDELREEYNISEEFKQFLGEHCFAFEPCYGSIIADPRVLFVYLRLAWMLNDGKDVKRLVELYEQYVQQQANSTN
jgi:hypothetical protein